MFTDDDRVFDLSDLGLGVPEGDSNFDQMVGEPDVTATTRLVPGSVAAQALRAFYEGYPVTLVNSPPGAGKSTLLKMIVSYILHHTDLSIHVVTPTNNSALELAAKIVDAAGPGTAVVNARDWQLPEGVLDVKNPYLIVDGEFATPDRQVMVTTVHAAKSAPPDVDLMIVDEAYQVTYGLLAEAADQSDQILMVGDPGQIGPVVTHDVSPWRGIEDAPAARSPEVLARMDAKVLTLPCTYRVGQETVDAIAPLYPFPFHSQRPDRRIVGLAEIDAVQIDGTMDARAYASLLADRALSMVGRTLEETSKDGAVTRRALTEQDVVVVAARNELVAGTLAELASRGVEGVQVGTADSLQGGQWHAVVAIDPLASPKQVSRHALDVGRLCVMTSRHMSHMTWMYSMDWESRVDAYTMSESEHDKSVRVRQAIVSKAVH